jgi:orotate phosphoribosyltransferase-like protein
MKDPIYYGETLYQSKDLSDKAIEYLEVLPPEVTHLITRGSSGNCIASAMLALSNRKLRHYHLRKNDEQAHSGGTVGYKPYDGHIAAIVDDFAETGNTIIEMLKQLNYTSIVIKYIIINTPHEDIKRYLLLHHPAIQLLTGTVRNY